MPMKLLGVKQFYSSINIYCKTQNVLGQFVPYNCWWYWPSDVSQIKDQA